MGALAGAIPDQVLAEGAGPTWALIMSGHNAHAEPFTVMTLLGGGQGASKGGAGMSVINFPGNAANTPVEVLEQIVPIRVERKECIRGSGGDGAHRGGDGQRLVLRSIGSHDLSIEMWADRTTTPALGLAGGAPGHVGMIAVNGVAVDPRHHITLHKGDLLVLETPGGGGYGASLASASAL
jgi:N-methylhydantoinase B